jgi:hypothetical protein
MSGAMSLASKRKLLKDAPSKTMALNKNELTANSGAKRGSGLGTQLATVMDEEGEGTR